MRPGEDAGGEREREERADDGGEAEPLGRFRSQPFNLLGPETSVLSMEMKRHDRRHRHTTVVTHALRQRAGIPYEVERKVCSACDRVIDERPVKRAAA